MKRNISHFSRSNGGSLWQNVSRLVVRLALIAGLLVTSFPALAETKIYFYNPDANLKDVAQLKSEVQEYFRKADSSASLTAFLRMEDLVAAIKSNPPDFLVATSWFTKNYAVKSGYRPLLAGRVGSSRSYTKVLIAKQSIPASGTASISMVRFGDNSANSLPLLVPNIRKFGNINVVEVSKDIDAVLAVSFGQVDMALVRQQDIDMIRKVNEAAVSNLQVLAHSVPIEYPVLSASPKASQAAIDQVVGALMSTKLNGRTSALDLMGFEGWSYR